MKIDKFNKSLTGYGTTISLIWKCVWQLLALAVFFYLFYQFIRGRITLNDALDILNRLK